MKKQKKGKHLAAISLHAHTCTLLRQLDLNRAFSDIDNLYTFADIVAGKYSAVGRRINCTWHRRQDTV